MLDKRLKYSISASQEVMQSLEDFRAKYGAEIRKFAKKKEFATISANDAFDYIFNKVVDEWEVQKYFEKMKEEREMAEKEAQEKKEAEAVQSHAEAEQDSSDPRITPIEHDTNQ